MSKPKIIRAVTVSQSTGFFRDIIPVLNKKGIGVVVLSSPGEEMDELRAKGVPIIEITMERHIALLKDMRALFQLIRVFRREHPDMVHSMTPKAGLLCMLAAWLTRVPRRVHTFTGLVWPTATGLSRKILMLTDWLTCACATHVLPEGEGVKNDLQVHITCKPMKVLGYGNVRGVDMEKFSCRDAVMNRAFSLRRKDVFTFIFVGRIVGDKGINELVQAFMRLLAQHVKVRLLLVGRTEDHLDPLSPETKTTIQTTAEIESVGAQYGDDLLAYYAVSDCFVFPSYREGFPNTVLEAGAMSLPSIVTDINGSREIIKDGENGLIIPSKDVDALYGAMMKMVQDEPMRTRMSLNARPLIASRYEQSFVRQCLLDFYDEILR